MSEIITMKETTILTIKNQKNKGLTDWFKKQFLIQKLNNPLGYMMATGVAGIAAIILTFFGLKIGLLVFSSLFALPIVFACIFNLEVGLFVMICAGFLVPFVGKFTSAPIGTALDGLLFAMAFGVVVQLSRNRDFEFLKHPISLLVIVWIYYNLIQVLNPEAGSRLAWVFTVRTVAIQLLLYFIACYAFKTKGTIVFTLKALIFWAFAAALYAFKQEFIGFSAGEMAWLTADPKRFELIFQWDRLRVFSFCSDPTTFGILMALMAVACLILATGPFSFFKRMMLIFAAICMVFGMAFAGSRTPFVLVPVGILFYTLMTFRRNTLIAAGVFILLGTGMMMKSTSSAVVWRIQSAFQPKADASVQVRLDNQKKIQPYIQSHPIGAGLGSTGAWGARFTPDSWLAKFAHDSLYVRLAVETGYIGLIIYLILLFVSLKTGIYYYYRCIDPEIKIYYLAVLTVVFLLVLASYPQEAITLLPNSVIFYVCLAMLVKLKDFDPQFATLKVEK